MKEISDSAKVQFIKNCVDVTLTLQANEELLKEEGFNPPEENYTLKPKNSRILIPSEYIRKNGYFIDAYSLNEIVKSGTMQKNIAYSLQLSDLYNYFINRFYIWGSVETMLLKSAIINIMSIFEALIFECANNICAAPSECSKHKTCLKCFNKKQRNNSFEALKRMQELKIVDFSDNEMQQIQKLIELRNRVHIRLSEENEFLGQEFSIKTYNQSVVYLKRLCALIKENGVPLYEK